MDSTQGVFRFTRLESVVFGAGRIAALGSELQRRHLSRALVVTGTSLGRSKLLDALKQAAGATLAGVFNGAAQHVPSRTVDLLVEEARRVGAD